MIAVGLTGGIGSGKSTVAALLAGRGAVVLDADEMAREVVRPGSEGLARLVARFGEGFLTPAGELDRGGLANLVFSDPRARADLNEIVHPGVAELMAARLAEQSSRDDVVVLDVPLLFESGGRARYGLAGVLVVDAPVDIAVARVMAARRMSQEDAEARVAAQASRELRLRQADFVILNIGTLQELEAMVGRAWSWMLGLSSGDVS